ncbi:MAG: nucleoside deaminase [Flavobacteriales bacterium]|nr:nucleoside deaminase [Flavobacteriales bacterium]
MALETTGDDFFMKQALREAQAAFEENEVPVGAVVVCNDRIIARAHNLTERLNDVTAHAEMQVITAAADFLGGKYLNQCTLYVSLEPCPMCAAALGWAQIKRVVFGAYDDRKGFTTLQDALLHPKTEVKGGVMGDDSAALLQRFFRERRKKS